MKIKILTFTAVLVLITAGTLAAKTFPLTSSPIAPAAAGKVNIHKDKNGNTEVTIKTEHLAKPGMLTPPATTYVVWFQETNGEYTNQGQLKVEKSLKSDFKTTTNLQNFGLIVTAENDPLVKHPSGEPILQAKVQGLF
jgi:hypothetical protein